MIPFLILRKRKQARRIVGRPSLGRALVKAFALIFVLVALHVGAMAAFEGMPAFDGFWLTLTTLFTVGYGDLAAKTVAGRWSTILLLYVGGIFTLANLAGQLFDWRADARERKWRGLWRWHMKDHLIILNAPTDNPAIYFERLLRQLRQMPRYGDCPVLIITRAFEHGLPEALANLGAAHYRAWGLDYDALIESTPQHARAVVVLAKSEVEPTSDSVTLDAIIRIRSLNSAVRVIAEYVDVRNASRMVGAGANAVVPPTRVHPEILARALVYPGTEKVLAELIDVEGAECARLEVHWEGPWRDAVARLMDAGVGTPVGYESPGGEIGVNPGAGQSVKARAVFALVNGDVLEAESKARAALNQG